NKYVKAVALNGQEITDFRIQHKDILAGGHLIFTMSDKPGN
ncbi:glycoside hydrolase family 92 protein, partial [Alistipes onderdonkii]